MAEKVTGDIGCEDGCAAARRKPWLKPHVIVSQQTRSVSKTTISNSEGHLGNTHNYGS